MGLPIRTVVCWVRREKGSKKGAAQGYKLQKNAKPIPPEKSETHGLYFPSTSTGKLGECVP